MKTTLVIDDTVMHKLRQKAARRGVTMSALVEAGLRRILEEPGPEREPPPALPMWDTGGARVDVANREALYGVLEGA
jgi:hypothetical protein